MTDEQRHAAAVEKLDKGRSGAEIARNGIPGILRPGERTAATINTCANEEIERRRRASTTITDAHLAHLWELHDESVAALKRYKKRKGEDLRELARIADLATKVQRAIAVLPKSHAHAPQTSATDNPESQGPETLRDRLANETTNGHNAENGHEAVRSHASAEAATRAAELLNQPAPRASQ